MATIIDGKKLAADVRNRAAAEVEGLTKQGIACGLAVVLVGDDQGSATYVRAKLRDCEQCGIPSRDFKLPEQTTQEELMDLVVRLNADSDIAGILVQMPLPSHLDAEAVVAAIDPKRTSTAFIRRTSAGSCAVLPACVLVRPRASWRCSRHMA